MGNFFPMMICGLFAVFWLSFGMLQLPTLGLAAPYSTDGTDAVAGAATKEFNAVIAIYLIVWGFAIFTFWIFTLKTNIVFCVKLLLASTAAFVLSGSYWKLSTGDYDQALKLQKVGGFIKTQYYHTDNILGWRSDTIRGQLSCVVSNHCDDGR